MTDYFKIVRYGQTATTRNAGPDYPPGRFRDHPYDFSWSFQTGKTVVVQALVDGTDSNTANIVLGYMQAVASADQQLLVSGRRARGR